MGLVDLRRKARARRGSREVLYREILPYRLELLTRVVVVALGGPPPLHELEGVDEDWERADVIGAREGGESEVRLLERDR